jgi:hypothetical protein
MLKVLITARYFAVDPEPLDLLRAHGCELVHSDIDGTLGDANVSGDRAIALLRDVDAAIVSSLPLTEHVLAHAGQLKMVAIREVGYDSVNVPTATARGIPVIVAPGFTESVADCAFALMLAVTRQVARADRGLSPLGHFDQVVVESVDLNARRATPQALAFWEAQGFLMAAYRLRRYRDPKSGETYIGAPSSDFASPAPAGNDGKSWRPSQILRLMPGGGIQCRN